MQYQARSRRLFLQGAGVAMAFPLLQSLLPRAARAQVIGTPVRYVQILGAYGTYSNHFFPPDSGLTQLAGGVYGYPLANIGGDVSKILGPAFTQLKAKFSILRGLRTLTSVFVHNACQATTASGPTGDNFSDGGLPFFSHSVDAVLASSPVVYPNPIGVQRYVNVCPSAHEYRNFSWTTVNGKRQHLDGTTDTSALLAKFVSFSSAPDSMIARKNAVMNAVYDDYRAVRDDRRLAPEDRTRFESYMSFIDQTLKGLAAPVKACTRPALQQPEPDEDTRQHNQANILTAAMACGLTRVVSYVNAPPYNPSHSYAHAGPAAPFADLQAATMRNNAYFLAAMDRITEGNGRTLLDNSIVYLGNEFGEGDSNFSPGHTACNFAVVAGGGGGQFKMGYYVDFRKTGGMPYNNLLVSFFNGMGLKAKDYEQDGVVGFGQYDAGVIASKNFSAYTATDAARRKPLPFLYTGPSE